MKSDAYLFLLVCRLNYSTVIRWERNELKIFGEENPGLSYRSSS